MFRLKKVLISASIILALSVNHVYAAPFFGNWFLRRPRPKYRDVVKPHLIINFSPRIVQNTSRTPTIILEYRDIGSGINKASLKIATYHRDPIKAIRKDITKYITSKTNYRATCVIPEYDPLEEGEWVISAQISDLAGNTTTREIWVQVVPQVGELLQSGKQAIANKDILTANDYFTDAVEIAPDNPEANFYYALTLLSVLPQTLGIERLLQDMGFKGPDGVNLTQAHLMDPLDLVRIELPAALETAKVPASFPRGGDFQEVVRGTIIWQLDRVIARLDKTLKAKNFISYLEVANPLTGNEKVELDYADAAMLKSLVCVFKAKAHQFLVTNLDADLVELGKMFTLDPLAPESLQNLLQQYPDLLSVKGEGVVSSVNAKDAYVLSIDSFLDALDSMSKETDEQSDDLISLNMAKEYQDERVLVTEQFKDIRRSLVAEPDSNVSAKVSQFINLKRVFTEPFSPRRILDSDFIPYFLKDHILPQLDYSLINLSNADITYKEFLPPKNLLYDGRKLESDIADVHALKASLESIRMASLGLLGYNLSADFQSILISGLKNGPPHINDILNDNPDLLKLSDINNIGLARNAFNSVLTSYKDMKYAFDYHEDFDQLDDILVPDSFYKANVDRFTLMFEGLNSMQVTLIDPDTQILDDEFNLNLGEFFVNKKDIRNFLPQFDEDNDVKPDTFPDATFGGITDIDIVDKLKDKEL